MEGDKVDQEHIATPGGNLDTQKNTSSGPLNSQVIQKNMYSFQSPYHVEVGQCTYG